jgi:hypothetical protein
MVRVRTQGELRSMKTRLITFLLLIVGFGVSAVAGDVASAAPLGQDGCELTQGTVDNFVEALDLHSDVFTEEDWSLTVNYEEDDYVIQVNRFPEEATGVTTVNYLIYDCGYNSRDLEDYYDDDGFDRILEVYDEAERTEECVDGGLTLYHYALEYDNDDYVSRFWIVEYSDTRVYDVQVTYLADEEDLLEDLAEQLFPELPSCSS